MLIQYYVSSVRRPVVCFLKRYLPALFMLIGSLCLLGALILVYELCVFMGLWPIIVLPVFSVAFVGVALGFYVDLSDYVERLD
jgi:hypothetical protein